MGIMGKYDTGPFEMNSPNGEFIPGLWSADSPKTIREIRAIRGSSTEQLALGTRADRCSEATIRLGLLLFVGNSLLLFVVLFGGLTCFLGLFLLI
jgi:hypothetical protein